MDVLAIEQREGVRLTWFVHNAVLRLPMCSSSHALLPRAAAAVSPTLHCLCAQERVAVQPDRGHAHGCALWRAHHAAAVRGRRAVQSSVTGSVT